MDDAQLSRHEKLRLRQVEQNQQREQAFQAKQAGTQRRKKIMLWSVGGAVLLLLLFVGLSFAMPGKLDSFAKCVHDSGAVIYGAIEWCHFTQEQAGMFGKSFKYVNYQDYRDAPFHVVKTPTWSINGQTYENVQSLERLSQLTGCALP
jgi:hypothetical protein